jgi:hypothetical protein
MLQSEDCRCRLVKCRRKGDHRLLCSVHLEKAALALAAACNEEDLVEIGGPLGRTLFLKSRNVFSRAKNHSLNNLSALALSIASMKSSQDDNEDEDTGS